MAAKKKGSGGAGGKGGGKGGADPDPVPFTMFRYHNTSSVPAKANVVLKPTYPKNTPPVTFQIPPDNFLGPGQSTLQSFMNVFNVKQVSGTVTCYVPGSSPTYPTHTFDTGDLGKGNATSADATTVSTSQTDVVITT